MVGTSKPKTTLGLGSEVIFRDRICKIIKIQRKQGKIYLTLEHVNNYAEVNTYNCFSKDIKLI